MDIVKKLIRIGAKGSAVTDLQRTLNQNGYNLKEDGIFGNNTLSAVKDYQKKNALEVDGVVGNKTWTALLGGNKSTSGSGTVASGTGASDTKSTDSGFSYKEYAESDTVKQAQAALDAQMAAKPGAYSSKWQAQIDDILARIQNREDFSYDVNRDALYQQYRDQYMQGGKMAMQDTMGQAAAMTGGYGNSYAATAGNQAYQAYLGKLNDVVPELYQMALDRYTREGDELMEQYALLGDQESQDYSRYMDEYNKYLTERDYLQGRYDAERDYDYGRYSDDKSYAYDEYQSQIAQDQWTKEYDERVRQYNEQFDFQKQQYDESVRQYNEQMAFQKQQYDDGRKASNSSTSGGSSGSSSSSSSSGNGSSNNGTGSSNKTSGVSDSIRENAASAKTNEDMAAYLDDLVQSGTLSEEEADALYEENLKPSQVGLSKRTWTVVDKGGINWFGGVDNNGKVKDQYGNTYTLDKLVTALVSEGMSKKDAKAYVKNLQARLGI